MRHYVAMTVFGVIIAGCTLFPTMDDKHYSIYFQPHSADLDQQAHQAVATAASVARANPALPITLAGFASPPDPADNEVLSNQRALNVRHALISDGIGADRINTEANGTTDPKGLPNLSVQRVDISIGR